VGLLLRESSIRLQQAPAARVAKIFEHSSRNIDVHNRREQVDAGEVGVFVAAAEVDACQVHLREIRETTRLRPKSGMRLAEQRLPTIVSEVEPRAAG
jgi:hypothetical protein